MINGVILTLVAFWYFLSSEQPDGKIFAVMAMLVMAIEEAMGFAVVIIGLGANLLLGSI